MKVGVRHAAGKAFYWLWCPACDSAIMIDDTWTWNGDEEKPTFSPSLLSRGSADSVCHSYITDGVWKFLGDCTHEHAGQELPAVDLPAWLFE